MIVEYLMKTRSLRLHFKDTDVVSVLTDSVVVSCPFRGTASAQDQHVRSAAVESLSEAGRIGGPRSLAMYSFWDRSHRVIFLGHFLGLQLMGRVRPQCDGVSARGGLQR